MNKLKSPRLVTLAIITTATIIFWIFFEVYRIFTTPSPAEVPEELMRPINPTLDSEGLDNIQARNYFEEGQIPNAPVAQIIIEVEQEPEPTPTEIPEQDITPTPTATESAEIQ